MGIGSNGVGKANDVSYNGTDQPLVTKGEVQTGGWSQIGGAPYFVSQEILQSVPAQTCVVIRGTGVTKVGNAANQFAVSKQLAFGTFQLNAGVTTASGADSDNPKGPFVWLSRNDNVCTVSATGVVTPTGKGQCEVEARYSRAANTPLANATPSSTESMAAYATCIVQIVG
jgi:hypothetical protein